MIAATARRALRGAGALTLLVVASVALGACAQSTAQPVAGAPAASATPAVPLPRLTITPGDGALNIGLDAAVTVAADSGRLDQVVLRSQADPTPLAGKLGADQRSWTSTAALDPSSRYVVEATAHSGGGSTSARAAFTTMAATQRLVTKVLPGDGATVGVAMPIVLTFNTPVDADKQAAVVSHIQVQTSTPLLGAWHWFGPSEVHWRPKELWPAHTQVTVAASLRGVVVNHDHMGLGSWTSSFSIGDKHLSVIDAAAHQMQVFLNDQLVHTYPVSTGKASSPTISGTLYVWYKLQKVRMVSTSIGIPVNAPGGYDEDVFWDTAISTDGFYIHSAPWSVASQGNTNVSHGCVNLSPANATEFYNYSIVGDAVQVKNTSRLADYSDGEADWQIPWEQWANSGGVTQAPAQNAAPGGA